MFDKVKTWFQKDQPSDEEEIDLPMALAALFVEAARADQQYDDREKNLILKMLKTRFNMSEDAATSLRARAEEAQETAADIHRFTKIAKKMPAPDRLGFVEEMWELILSDDERNEYEDALMRRICGLIHIEDRESGEARHRAMSKRGKI